MERLRGEHRWWRGAGDLLAAERDRWFLWLPVAMGLGVVFYFALGDEPPMAPAPAVAVLAGLGAFLFRRKNSLLAIAAIGLAAMGCGFTVAQLRTMAIEHRVLEREIGPGGVSGRIIEIEAREHGAIRLSLDHVVIDGMAPEAGPERVRLTVRAKERPKLAVGDWVDLWAVLAPPEGPAVPGGFDFARHAYFERLGASGYALGSPRLMTAPEGASSSRWGLRLGALRQQVNERILAALDASAGGIAAALLVGERGAISEAALAAMRDSGLAHLLAISGLHVGIVAGLVFVVLRALLALVEPLALRYPIKKWAAAATIPVIFGYMALSGASVPTQRAFLMTGLVMLAVMVDRTSISMRLIAWAAIAVLAVAPESLLGASFQMSFAATMALIAAYESARGPLARWQARAQWSLRPLVYVAGVALTTVVAGLATAPFAAFHFNRLADYSLIANLAAVPLTAFWIMPWGMAALALMPWGLERLALLPMGWGIDAMLWVAHGVAGLGGAVSRVAAMPPAALGLMVAGGLWLCLWRRRWRFWGLAALVAGVALAPFGERPQILIDGEGKLFAVETEDGGLALSDRRRAKFEAELWLDRYGLDAPSPWVGEEGRRLACDGLGCLYRADGRLAALVMDEAALLEDCQYAEVIVSLVPVASACAAPLVVDRFDLWREGAHAVWLEEDGVRIESAADDQGSRPWSVRRGGR